ncbi:MAG: adenylate/guanylate cyclase domain-containing protein [Candidatus Riflebacteria bacterium]|nr:adenylate/guanylate cyclase domain-containing protein [Candidatus Riflebacteria bacterium]
MKLERNRYLWELSAKYLVENFRSNISPDFFRNELGQKALRFRKMIEKEIQVNSQENISHLFPEKIEKNLFKENRPIQAYAILIEKSGFKIIEGPGFSNSKKIAMTKFLKALNGYETLTSDEIKRFDNFSKNLFGILANFSIVWNQQGRTISTVYEKKNRELLWDTIDLKNGRSISYLLIFQADSSTPGLRIKKALRKIEESNFFRKSISFHPVLISVKTDYKVKKCIFPSNLNPKWKSWVATFAKRKKILTKKNELVPFGKSIQIDNSFVLRELIDIAIPFEILIFSRFHTPVAEKWFHIFMCLFLSIGILTVYRAALFGEPFVLSLRKRFSLFFSVIGILPLIILFAAGYLHIEASQSREERLIIKDTLSKIEELDVGSESVVSNAVDSCRKLISDKKWLSLIKKSDDKSLKEAASQVFSFLEENSIPMHFFIVNFEGNLSKCFFSQTLTSYSKPKFAEAVNAFFNECQKFLPLSSNNFQEAPPMEDIVGNLASFEGLSKMEVFRNFMRRQSRSEILDFNQEKNFHFHDMVYSEKLGCIWLYFFSNLGFPFQAHFQKSLTDLEWTLKDGMRNFGALRVSSREQKLIFPQNDVSFWQSQVGKKLQKFMSESGKSLALQVIPEKGGMYISFACQHTPGFVLSAYISLGHIIKKKTFNISVLGILTLILSFPVFYLARKSAEYIIEPILAVETGLFRVINGDLTTRVLLPRQDELGEMTGVFDMMIQGLEKRKNLAFFVSGSLEAGIEERSDSFLPKPLFRDGVILFSDLRNFTGISEKIRPDEVVRLLNKHFETMASYVEENGGFIENFIGDAIVASFFKETFEASSLSALKTSIQMVLALRKINQERKQCGLFEYKMGIGLDGGKLMVGTISAMNRLEHIVSGETKKNAEYLESLSKVGKSSGIIISQKISIYLKPEYLLKLPDSNAFEIEEAYLNE